jgi:hypothetical protein
MPRAKRGFNKRFQNHETQKTTIRIRAQQEAANCDSFEPDTLMQPLLYFSYGMTKTGSTLAFELARTALDLCGYPQDPVPIDGVATDARVNFVNTLPPAALADMAAYSRKLGHPLALKTHARPPKDLAAMITRGEALVQISYRDPRDMALSMLDHGTRARASGQKSFSELKTLTQTMENIRQQFKTLSLWLRLPQALPLYFEDVGFQTKASAQRVLQQLGLRLEAETLADVVQQHRFTQKNKARPLRYPDEMPEEQAEAIGQEFAAFIRRFITNRASLPTDGRPLLSPTESLHHVAGHLPQNQRV